MSQHSQRTYHVEFDDDADDAPENRFEDIDDGPSLSTALVPSSATTTRPLQPSPPCPSGRRQELVWKPLQANSVALKDISRQFWSLLSFHRSSSGPVLSSRRGRYPARTSHRCPGYSRIEVTLTTDILRSAIISHSNPTPGEICLICKQVVMEEISSCSCCTFDDGPLPTVLCSACFEWHYYPCVDTEIFCRRCTLREGQQQRQHEQRLQQHEQQLRQHEQQMQQHQRQLQQHEQQMQQHEQQMQQHEQQLQQHEQQLQ
ncbi:hypothetical protein GALMADRAFT_1201190 [Galerina marginata CBS 339.88]|uniref:Uncharacterized protein n=1 Tax=Galerina marginata (strain CBS 339.88) TaxID=685588 RepID=A0A067TKP5_GALM3|nr:hypothetical protein GALMADRAFT_1201190 [Galerina marginata CBS 339.88]